MSRKVSPLAAVVRGYSAELGRATSALAHALEQPSRGRPGGVDGPVHGEQWNLQLRSLDLGEDKAHEAPGRDVLGDEVLRHPAPSEPRAQQRVLGREIEHAP